MNLCEIYKDKETKIYRMNISLDDGREYLKYFYHSMKNRNYECANFENSFKNLKAIKYYLRNIFGSELKFTRTSFNY